MTPRSRKSGYGLLLGCRSQLDAGPFEELFFDDVRKMNVPKIGKVITVRFGPALQLIGRGRLSREGALDVRESRERRDKIVPKSSPEKRRNEKRNFGLIFFHFVEHDRLLFARVEIGVTEFLKNSRKRRRRNFFESLRFFFKSGRAQSRFQRGISFFWPRKNELFL